jgi:hypothetical protein
MRLRWELATRIPDRMAGCPNEYLKGLLRSHGQIYSASGDPQPPCQRRRRFTPRECVPNRSGINAYWAALLLAFVLRFRDSLALTFQHDLALPDRHAGQDRQHEL